VLFPFGPSTNQPRVVITGAGIVTALGIGWKNNAAGFRLGKNAVRPVTLFDVSRQRVKMAAQAELPNALPATHLSPRQVHRMDRATKLLVFAAYEAWHISRSSSARPAAE
jgi:3-oxoacyl-[acyl-carrier-protein] synthase II